MTSRRGVVQTTSDRFAVLTGHRKLLNDVSRPAGLENRAGRFSGDHTCGATPVPIPNTAVKPAGPMIVHSARKSVIAGKKFERPGSHQVPGAGSCVPGML